MKNNSRKFSVLNCERNAGREAFISFSRGFINDLFTVFIILYVSLLIMELFKPLSVSFFFNTNILLIGVAVIGAIMILGNCMEPVLMGQVKSSSSGWKIWIIGSVSVITMLIIISYATRMGRVTYPMGVGLGVMAFIISMQLSVLPDKGTGLE